MKARFFFFFLLLSFVVFLACQKKQIKVTTEKATLRDITETVTASGKIQPVVEVKISPDVSGEIVELPVYEGQEVKKGQLIARIRPDNYQAALEQMQASLNTAKADLANAKAALSQAESRLAAEKVNVERSRKLFADKVISQVEMDNAELAYNIAISQKNSAEQQVEAAKYRIESAEASLKQARENLNRTSLYAPMSGIISKLSVKLGERVVGTSQMAGTEMMRIADLTQMEVKVDVNENDIVNVSLHDSVRIEVDAYTGKTFAGRVTNIANSSNNLNPGTASTDQITNFEVRILISSHSYKEVMKEKNKKISPFLPGMSANVEIYTNTLKNVLSVPSQSVTTRTKNKNKDKQGLENQMVKNTQNDKPDEVVFLYQNGIVKQVVVKTGIADNQYIQIVSGLKEGDEVVSGSYRAIAKELKDGMRVKKVSEQELN
ncbi:MAG: efflux RND transporter periplasmic adaptor subunit [Bacteroidia bacterium]|nr:efflux RND transporter periplasmic adaptor subunit [Bacteroidia bacterium]MDW8348127.1 efflux RND transporter periplasmic adaptor subunit [Bacteroidia bacterium]